MAKKEMRELRAKQEQEDKLLKAPKHRHPKIQDYTVTFENLEKMGFVRVIGLGYVHLSECPT